MLRVDANDVGDLLGNDHDATFLSDVSAMMTDNYLREVTGYGLFAWSWMDDDNFDGPEEATQYQIVKDAVLRYGRFP